MAILDYLGRPVDVSQLDEEIADPKLGTMRPVLFEGIANNLTPEVLGTLISGVDQNDIIDYLTLAEEMEERDLHYSSVLRTRKLAVSGLEVAVTSPTDDSKDIEIAEFVEDLLVGEKGTQLISDQLDALGKGFSVNEIMWDRSKTPWIIREFKWRDPRLFQFDMDTMQELRLRDEEDPMNGIELEPYKFVVHRPRLKTGLTIRGGLARLAAVAYMCKGYTLKDWLAFAETFGMPLRVGKYKSSATATQKSRLLNAVTSIGMDAACIIPDSMMIELIERSGSTGGEKLFEGLANWLDSQVSKGILGQTMTTDDGSSMSQAKVHQEVRDDIKVSDAQQLGATIQRDVVKPLVDLNFGVRDSKIYPRVKLVIEEPEDLETLSKSLPPFIKLGLRVEESVILDKFGLQTPEDDARILGEQVATDEAPEKARSILVSELLANVRKGIELTADQRLFLSGTFAQQDDSDEDEIDRLTDEHVSDWKRVMDPVLQPILTHAQSAKGYQEFLDGLEEVLAGVNSTELVESLALSMFKARGLGDGTDEV